MIQYLRGLSAALVLVTAFSCANRNTATETLSRRPAQQQLAQATLNSVPVIHVFVALADNVNQGIVPVSPSLGDGDNPKTNLYWGAAFGVKTFFAKESGEQIQERAARAYDKYQHCGLRSARALFASGW